MHPRENDLIVGTHGRGAWILDDIAPLQGLADAMRSDVYLFEARPAVRWQSCRRGASLGQRGFVAENPEDGAYINYYLKEVPEDGVRSRSPMRTARSFVSGRRKNPPPASIAPSGTCATTAPSLWKVSPPRRDFSPASRAKALRRFQTTTPPL